MCVATGAADVNWLTTRCWKLIDCAGGAARGSRKLAPDFTRPPPATGQLGGINPMTEVVNAGHQPTPDTTSDDRPAKLRGHLGVPAIVLMVVAASAPLSTIGGNVPIAMALGNTTGIPVAFIVAGVIFGLFAASFIAMSEVRHRRRRLLRLHPRVARPGGRASGAAVLALPAYMATLIAVAAYDGVILNELITRFGGPGLLVAADRAGVGGRRLARIPRHRPQRQGAGCLPGVRGRDPHGGRSRHRGARRRARAHRRLVHAAGHRRWIRHRAAVRPVGIRGCRGDPRSSGTRPRTPIAQCPGPPTGRWASSRSSTPSPAGLSSRAAAGTMPSSWPPTTPTTSW